MGSVDISFRKKIKEAFMPNPAIIDIGTNSIKLLITKESAHTLKTIHEENFVTRLGDGLYFNHRISDAAKERNLQVIENIVRHLSAHKAELAIMVGTMCLREAENTLEFQDELYNRTGYRIRVLSAEEEAEYSYKAVISDFFRENTNIITFDTGGGSTEFNISFNQQILLRESISIGVVTLLNRFFRHDPVTAAETNSCIQAIKDILSPLPDKQHQPLLVGIGGTVTSLTALELKSLTFPKERIHGFKLKLQQLNNLIDMLSVRTIEERRLFPGMTGNRADIIYPGALLVREIIHHFSADEIVVSTKGLRHAILTEITGKSFDSEVML